MKLKTMKHQSWLRKSVLKIVILPVLTVLSVLSLQSVHAADISRIPLFLTQGVEPQVMLTLSNDHQLYFEAYPEYLDLDGSGEPNLTYTHTVDYYGYFDSQKCYSYSTGDNARFQPKSISTDKYCNDGSSDEWSGNFLNWLSMSRIDVVRKILFGGMRQVDTGSLTVLERSYLPTDAHSWSRYYNNSNVNKLTPFTNPPATVGFSDSEVEVSLGEKDFDDTELDSNATLQRGDQLLIEGVGSNIKLFGVVTDYAESDGDVQVEVTSFEGSQGVKFSKWRITNNSRAGISFCNTTRVGSGVSESVTAPPELRVAKGNYSLWRANERWQCHWWEEKNTTGHNNMRVGGNNINFSNGNDVGATGIFANSDNPRRGQLGLGEKDYVVRVEACSTSDLIGTERCKQYPDENYKPIGLLQQYGDDDEIFFGLMTGSYERNKSGGVLRKNLENFSNEVDVAGDGSFKTAPTTGAIVETLNLLRIAEYDHGDGNYNNCGMRSGFPDGVCVDWGNPQSEIFLEAIRYFADLAPTSGPNDMSFSVGVGSNNDVINGLREVPWNNPVGEQNYCAPSSIINFNASVASYDTDQLSSASGLPGTPNIASFTNKIGAGENIHGSTRFIGRTAGDDNQICTPKTVSSLADVDGLCPEAPRLEGGYAAAGLANYAYTNDLRPDLNVNQFGKQTVKTFSVALAPAVPRIDIPKPGETATAVTILPACQNNRNADRGNCAIVDFKIIAQDAGAGTGSFLVQWEAHEQGGDFDSDMNGVLSYVITDSQLEVTTKVFAQSSGMVAGFGYVTSGTTADGFHAHSGVNNYDYTDPTGGLGCNNCVRNNAETTRIYSFQSAGNTAELIEQPMFYAAKWGGYDKALNFPASTNSWDKNNDGLPDNYYYATDPSKLADDLEKVFLDILEDASSATSVASNSSRLSVNSAIFQARFNSENWSGDLLGRPIDEDGNVATTVTDTVPVLDENGDPVLDEDGNVTTETVIVIVTESVSWSAADMLDSLADPVTSRNIITNDPVSGVGATAGELIAQTGKEFTWDNLTTAQQEALQTLPEGGIGLPQLGQDRLAYLKGSRVQEQSATVPSLPFRERGSRLGDIVNSNPQFLYRTDYGYGRLDETSEFTGITTTYKTFRESTVDRPPVVIVGANDGMLHAFNADVTAGSEGGKELFAYVPSGIYENLYELTLPDYLHRYYVDGTPRVADAWLGAALGWKTMVVGTTGAGGRSVFALDVTDPETVNASSFMWEFSHPDLGVTIQQPNIVALPDGTFGVVVTSGYDSTGTGGKVWILNAETGRPKVTFSLPTSGELGSALVIDRTGDRITDHIYVGDTDGNVWRIDIDGNDTSLWGVPSGFLNGSDQPVPLFTAQAGQAITAPLSAALNPEGKLMIFFGTGSFFRNGDNVVPANPQVEAFYGIIDEGSPVTTAELVEQEILREAITSSGTTVRAVSDNSLSSTQKGWFIELQWKTTFDGGTGPKGEKVVTRALVRGDRIIFTTLIPSADLCAAGGTSFIMELNTFTGSRLGYSVFDTNNDGAFNDGDFVLIEIDGVEVRVPISGIDPGIGIAGSASVLEGVGENNDERKILSGSSGQLISVPEAGTRVMGRQNWEQVR